MPGFVEGFVITDVAETHALYARVIALAERAVRVEREQPGFELEAAATLARLKTSYNEFRKNLDAAAVRGAAVAVIEMRKAFDATATRTVSTGAGIGLRALINARPLSLALESGAVGIGDEVILSRAINPRTPGYGTYWRAQEYGTGNDGVPSQVGRVIRGLFDGTDAPASEYAGGGGPAKFFIPGRAMSAGGQRSLLGSGPRGGFGGYGTISVEVPARHFIRDGAAAAAAEWEASIAKLQGAAITELGNIASIKL